MEYNSFLIDSTRAEIEAMQKQRILLQPAYVLHSRAYRNTSSIVDVITPEYGRVALVAKGIKRQQSHLRVALQLFQPLLISWVGGKELATLTQAEIQGKSLSIDAELIVCGFYLNELLMKMLHQHDPHIDVFSQYDIAVRALSRLQSPPNNGHLQTILREFELGLLHALGYGLIFSHEANSNTAIEETASYRYVFNLGPERVSEAMLPTEHRCSGIVSGKTLLALSRGELINYCDNYDEHRSLFAEARQLLSTVIDFYLGHAPLKSRDLLRRIGRGKNSIKSSQFPMDHSQQQEIELKS